MNAFYAAACGLLAPVAAQAGVLVDTGTPTQPLGFFAAISVHAGQFTARTDWTITSVQGHFGNEHGTDSQVAVALHRDAPNARGGVIPGEVLYSATFTLAGGAGGNWHGIDSLNWSVLPGAYWVSFRPDFNARGSHYGDAPHPLDEYALGFFGGWAQWPMDFFDGAGAGLRIQGDITAAAAAVPEPGTLALFGVAGAGLGVMALRRRQRQAV